MGIDEIVIATEPVDVNSTSVDVEDGMMRIELWCAIKDNPYDAK